VAKEAKTKWWHCSKADAFVFFAAVAKLTPEYGRCFDGFDPFEHEGREGTQTGELEAGAERLIDCRSTRAAQSLGLIGIFACLCVLGVKWFVTRTP
jgi:hypothetical protein